MEVAFYGTRGYTPVPDPDFLQFSGNTSCILLTFDSGRIAILDAGTGIRKLGDDLIAASHEQYDNIFIVLSHTHWGHIRGKDREAKDLESIFSTQMCFASDRIGAFPKLRPLKNVHFCSSSRKGKILTTGIH